MLVGMKNGTAALENSLVVPQNIKYADTIWPSNFTSRDILQRTACRDVNRCLYSYVHSRDIHRRQKVEPYQWQQVMVGIPAFYGI